MKKEICKYCTHYTAYYKIHCTSYQRLTNGFCSKHQKPQIQSETCQNYKNNEQKQKRKEEQLLYTLEQALNWIIQIAQMLKEKQGDQDIDNIKQ